MEFHLPSHQGAKPEQKAQPKPRVGADGHGLLDYWIVGLLDYWTRMDADLIAG
jgi:hypothetical protein